MAATRSTAAPDAAIGAAEGGHTARRRPHWWPRRSGGRRGLGRWARWLVVASVAMTTGYFGLVAAEVEMASRQQAVHPADAAVVMGAAQYDGTPSGALAGRLDQAAQLYENGMVDRVVVTGGNQPGDRTTEGMTGFVYLRNLGVPEEALLVENSSTNTWEQLLAAKLIIEEYDIETVILVSDPYHNRRLLDTAGELGIDAQVSPADSSVTWPALVRETGAVAAGKIIGFRRLAEF